MEYGTVLARRKASSPPRGGGVMEEALRRGWIAEFAEGQYIYRPRWAALVRLLQVEIVARAQALGFEEWIFPRCIPEAALDSFQLTQFTPDLLADGPWNSFLDPVQCVSFYHHHRGRRFAPGELPLRAVEVMGGWTWRNEAPESMDGPYRAREFLRVEHVFLGTPEQVRTQRRLTRENLTDLLTRLGLGWQIVVGHGCMDIASLTAARLAATHADEVPIQDIEVPIRGALEKLPDLPPPGTTSHAVMTGDGLADEVSDADYWDHDEICGCSVEGDHLTRRFAIADADGEPLWSGCCGIGLNRLMVALLYQHGFDDVHDVVRGAVAR